MRKIKLVMCTAIIAIIFTFAGCQNNIKITDSEEASSFEEVKEVNEYKNVLKKYDSLNIDMTYGLTDGEKDNSRVFNIEKNESSYNIVEKLSSTDTIYYYNNEVYYNDIFVCYFNNKYEDIIAPYFLDRNGFDGFCGTSAYYENLKAYYDESYYFLENYDIDDQEVNEIDGGFKYSYEITTTDDLKKLLADYGYEDTTKLVIEYQTDTDKLLLSSKMSVYNEDDEKTEIYSKDYTYNDEYKYSDSMLKNSNAEDKYQLTFYENHGTDKAIEYKTNVAKDAKFTLTSLDSSKTFYNDSDYEVQLKPGSVMSMSSDAYVFVNDSSNDVSGVFGILSLKGTSFANTNESIIGKMSYLQDLINVYYSGNADKAEMESNIYKAMLEGIGDKYAAYYTPDEYKRLMESDSGIYSGIGAVLSQDADTGIITIVTVYEGSASYENGLLSGDIIYSVDGEEVTGKDLSTVASSLKGEEGTQVKVQIVREGENDYRTYDLTRSKVEIPTVSHEMMGNNIGYIKVATFDTITSEQFKEAIDDLKSQGAQKLIIDLRNNTGGLVTSACEMLDLFIDDGVMITTDNTLTGKSEKRATKGVDFSGKMAVLINKNTASSSEIFTGALQDDKLATIVGTKSFGKGIIQSIFNLPDGSGVKLTIGEYYLPSGRSIHEVGITPDIEVELDEKLKTKSVITLQEDNQVKTAVNALMEK